MSTNRLLIFVWLLLLGLTVTSVLMAERPQFGNLSVIIVCTIISLKGQLIIDRLVGLRHANQSIRRVMLGYFYTLPLLIALGVIFPQVLVTLTTLN